jgi:hypothetical protein
MDLVQRLKVIVPSLVKSRAVQIAGMDLVQLEKIVPNSQSVMLD